MFRQNWTLRKFGNTIVGDLGYKSAGSRYPHTCNFEVSKSEDVVPGIGTEVAKEKDKPSMIKISIPTELEGTAYIQVTIQKGMLLKQMDWLLATINFCHLLLTRYLIS